MNNPGSVPNPIIDIRNLTRTFGSHRALDHVSLTVPQGTVLGVVGVNGSGKTTLIKHILGLLKAQAGSVQIFGLNPVTDPVGVLSRIGYLSENSDLPEWMRVREVLRYTSAFYSRWDFDFADQLRISFKLDLDLPIKSLSRGLRARLGLLLALGHRPELLVLDEPSSGLDPLARRDILAAVVRTVASEGRTVLFSSHLLDEIERVADHIAFIDKGRVLFHGPLDEVRQQHRRLTLRFSQSRTTPPSLAGVLTWEGEGHEWTALCVGEGDQVRAAVGDTGGQVVEEAVPRLDEVFAAHAGGNPGREV